MAYGGFHIDKRAIAKMSKEIEREFAKHPVRVPIETDQSAISGMPATSSVTNYNGPVVHIHGDHAQLAWGNGSVEQNSAVEIAPGFEALAEAVAELLASTHQFRLDADSEIDFRDAANSVLAEVTTAEPDPGKVRRGVALLKGFLSAAAVGANTGVSAETSELARQAIESLSGLVS